MTAGRREAGAMPEGGVVNKLCGTMTCCVVWGGPDHGRVRAGETKSVRVVRFADGTTRWVQGSGQRSEMRNEMSHAMTNEQLQPQ